MFVITCCIMGIMILACGKKFLKQDTIGVRIRQRVFNAVLCAARTQRDFSGVRPGMVRNHRPTPAVERPPAVRAQRCGW